MTEIRITVTNTSPQGGTFLTPFWFGLHDAGFDLFDIGAAVTPGLEAIAEDGTFDLIVDDLLAADPEGQGGVVLGAAGPIATQETTFADVSVNDPTLTPLLSVAAMLLPSNDAFVGSNVAVELFDETGAFIGPRTITFDGDDVLDAGTEMNTELDAAFINQTAPNTGIDENGVVAAHPGFNGSVGNPVGDGDQIILGGTNAFGEFIDPVLADFTQPNTDIATITVQEIVVDEGTDGDDLFQIDAVQGLLRIEGGVGDDIADIVADLDDFSVVASADGFRFIDADENEIEIRDVERIFFEDDLLILTGDETVDSIALVYEATLDRGPDVAGLSFWTSVASNGASVSAIADAFLASPEFDAVAGDVAETDAFLDFLYDAALGRAADDAGAAFWGGLLDDGSVTRGEVVAGFVGSAEMADVFAADLDRGYLIDDAANDLLIG